MLKRLRDRAIPRPPEQAGSVALETAGAPLNRVRRAGYFLMWRLNQLLRHAVKSGSDHQASSREMDTRLARLRAALESTRREFQHSQDAAEQLQRDALARIAQVNRSITVRLETISGDLEQRIRRAERVLGLIESIANQSKMLALNTQIEATRVGSLGLEFSVLAKEMRRLALDTQRSSLDVTKHLSLGDFEASVVDFRNNTTDALARLGEELRSAIADLNKLFSEISDELKVIEENSNVIFEFFSLDASANRAYHKSTWSYRLSRQVMDLFDDRQSGDLATSMEEVMRYHHVPADPKFDRLTQIQSRGFIRIAIEPAFIGLSFRARPSDPLMGLDVDYATAFARWLGVRCEFVEHPWDICPELLEVGKEPGLPEADIMWSALPPQESPSYDGIAFSDSYTYLHYVLARSYGDTRINRVEDLEGKVVGCINDPAAFRTLEQAGVRWEANAAVPGGRVRVANLIAYTDQTRIHDCLAQGAVDAFTVDLPIYYWACNSAESRWQGKIEILPGNLAPRPWHYAAGVLAHPSSHRLLSRTNEFIRWFKDQSERADIERKWQGVAVHGRHSYQDEPGTLLGEADIEPSHWEGHRWLRRER